MFLRSGTLSQQVKTELRLGNTLNDQALIDPGRRHIVSGETVAGAGEPHKRRICEVIFPSAYKAGKPL